MSTAAGHNIHSLKTQDLERLFVLGTAGEISLPKNAMSINKPHDKNPKIDSYKYINISGVVY